MFPALEPGSFLPARTSPKLTHAKPRHPALPSHCPPWHWGGLSFPPCSPAFPCRSPGAEAVPHRWPRVPALPAQLRPHRGSIYSFYPILDAQPAPADLDLKFSRRLEPFCSWILGWRCFRHSGSGSCRRRHSPRRRGRRSWLRVGITAQPETVGLVPWAGRAAELLQLFLCCL